MPLVDLTLVVSSEGASQNALLRFKYQVNTRLRFVNVKHCYLTPRVKNAFEISNRETGRVYYSKQRLIGCTAEDSGFPGDSLERFQFVADQLIEDGAVPVAHPPPFENYSTRAVCSLM